MKTGPRAARVAGGAFLGMDLGCLAAIDVPEAERLAGLRRWGVLSVATAGVAGVALGWLSAGPILALPLGAGVAAFVWNLLRLGMSGGAAVKTGAGAVARWTPGRGAAGVLLVFGAVLAQPALALTVNVVGGPAFEARRSALFARLEEGITRSYTARLGELESAAAVSSALAARLEADRAELDRQQAEELAAQRAALAARLGDRPLFASAVAAGWDTPLGPGFTAAFSIAVAAPALARRLRLRALRQYERERVRRERALVDRAWDRSEARVVALLRPWPTFSGTLRPVSTDPPFDDRPLLLGFAHGTVVPTDTAELRRHIPGYDEACTSVGRVRAAERDRLHRQLAAAAGESRPARFHRARTLIALARVVGPIQPELGATHAREALALARGLLGEGTLEVPEGRGESPAPAAAGALAGVPPVAPAGEADAELLPAAARSTAEGRPLLPAGWVGPLETVGTGAEGPPRTGGARPTAAPTAGIAPLERSTADAERPAILVVAIEAALEAEELGAAAELAAALLALAPGHARARGLQARVLGRRAEVAGPAERLAMRREALSFAAGTPGEGMAKRNLARALLPRGGPEASTLAEAGYFSAKEEGNARTLAAALQLVAATNPARAPACLPEAADRMQAVWAEDPTPANALDLALLVAAAAGRSNDPHKARLDTARALALAEQVALTNPSEHAARVVEIVRDMEKPPLLAER